MHQSFASAALAMDHAVIDSIDGKPAYVIVASRDAADRPTSYRVTRNFREYDARNGVGYALRMERFEDMPF